MPFEDSPETSPEIIQAMYQTQQKLVLYAEILLATGQSSPVGSVGSGTSGGAGAGLGGGFEDAGGGILIEGSCFATDTPVFTPHGYFNFRQIYDRFTKGARKIYSFDNAGNLEIDYVKNIWHHRAKCLTLIFENGKEIKATPEHLIYPAFGEKKAVRDFRIGDTNIFRVGDDWRDLKLLDVIEGSQAEEVWNMGIRKNKSYLPNDLAASNRKNVFDEEPPQF